MIETPAVAAAGQAKVAPLPPRPNLGPEPWSRPNPSPAVVAGLGSTFLIFAFAALLFGRYRRRKRMKSPSIPVNNESASSLENAPEIVAWFDRVRALLVARFGPTWNAKTTEELLAAPELLALLDPDRLERLSLSLLSADRAKFASIDDPIPHEERLAVLEELELILKPLKS